MVDMRKGSYPSVKKSHVTSPCTGSGAREWQKEVWGSLAADLLIRWAGLVPKAEVISIANKVPAYVGMGAMSQDQKTQVMAVIEALLV